MHAKKKTNRSPEILRGEMNADLRRWAPWSAAFPRPRDEADGVWAEGRFEVRSAGLNLA
jgi:hypothetical protein